MEVNDTVLFFDKFAVALVATAVYPETISYDRIRQTMLPEDFITDERYSKLFDAMQELYMPVLDDYKKKTNDSRGKGSTENLTWIILHGATNCGVKLCLNDFTVDSLCSYIDYMGKAVNVDNTPKESAKSIFGVKGFH